MEGRIQQRVALFTALQAAQRALAHSTHPSKLASLRTTSRELFVALQRYSRETPTGDVGESLEQIDQNLKGLTERVLGILRGLKLAHLKATVPQLIQKHPEEVRGLVDVLLSGDLEEDMDLRTLEYLITNLCTQEQGGHRTIAVEPASVTRLLQRTANQRIVVDDDSIANAERYLEKATANVLVGADLGGTRDRVLRFKKDLGSDLFHPRTLRAAVTYNVAMYNRTTEEIDESRSIDDLVANLDEPRFQGDPSVSATSNGGILESVAFDRLVSGFAATLRGDPVDDESAMRVIRVIADRPIRKEDRDALEGVRADEVSQVTRIAIVLGLILLDRVALAEPLRQLELDVNRLASECLGELMNRMSRLARESFSASNYGDAFRLSDVKTHSLSHHVVSTTGDGIETAARLPSVGPNIGAERPGALTRLAHHNLRVPSGLWAVGFLIMCMAAVPKIIRQDSDEVLYTREELAYVSPFLEKGQQYERNEATYFVGEINRTWDFLATTERKSEATAIGDHFRGLGAEHVTLVDANRVIVANYENGRLRILLPRPTREPRAGEVTH